MTSPVLAPKTYDSIWNKPIQWLSEKIENAPSEIKRVGWNTVFWVLLIASLLIIGWIMD
jgi:hypothetical protein